MSGALWIVIGVLFLLLLGGSRESGAKKKTSRSRAVRIDRTHYYDPDDYECSACGARFQKKSMSCPRCGARFTGTEEDDDEFIEEMVFWEEDEEN